MTRIDISNFRGRMPRVHPRNLPDYAATAALNAEFETTMVSPIQGVKPVTVFGADTVTAYLFGTTWIGWAAIVDVARAPVAENRIYYTGDGAPKVRDGVTIYDLALLAPTGAPTTVNLSAPSGTVESILFCYTHVTSLGEESPPSPLSAPLNWSAGVVTRINGFAAVPSGRGITHRRIYRSQTSAAGVTGLFFAAEITVATTSYDFDIAATPLQELLPSSDYDPPPAGLLGLTTLPNGMMAAFEGNNLYFCEPYQPHAWPEKYVLTTDYPIVGLSSFGSTLAILTSGLPYIAQGTTPDSMQMEKMETGLPCLSRRGIVDIGYAALYPSVEGLVMVSATEARVVTQPIFTRDQWLDLAPDSIIADRHKGQYVFLHNINADTVYDGGPAGGWPALDRIDLEGDSATLTGGGMDHVVLNGGVADSSFGERRIGILDFEGERADFSTSDVALPVAMFRDEASSLLYMIDADQRTILEWQARDSARTVYTWRSKKFTSRTPVSFGAIFVRTEIAVVTDDVFEIRVFADDRQIAIITKANRAARLPAGRLAEEWQVEIYSNVSVVSVHMAGTIDELLEAA